MAGYLTCLTWVLLLPSATRPHLLTLGAIVHNPNSNYRPQVVFGPRPRPRPTWYYNQYNQHYNQPSWYYRG
ncbi:hypothetical protein Hamer_G014886 [Homarus americanus]|uniref:Uncharacterized protein n=1 Tax=Homarus americanus TaxID=6706 RepID=A0A8J5JM20_HOMAM|nr:hypothetical protein Hamer_G014886 [Homarus americanus]